MIGTFPNSWALTSRLWLLKLNLCPSLFLERMIRSFGVVQIQDRSLLKMLIITLAQQATLLVGARPSGLQTSPLHALFFYGDCFTTRCPLMIFCAAKAVRQFPCAAFMALQRKRQLISSYIAHLRVSYGNGCNQHLMTPLTSLPFNLCGLLAKGSGALSC